MLEFPAENGLNTMLHLSISTWAEILREMEPRALVELLSGSYDDLATARIRRFG